MKGLVSVLVLTTMLLTFVIVHALQKTIPSEASVYYLIGPEDLDCPWAGFDEKRPEFPGPRPQGIYKYVTIKEPYRNWDLWPDKGKFYKGQNPHGAYLTTYINDIARIAINLGRPMFNRSIIVQENYTPEKKLAVITLMYKIKQYNPFAGDWCWAKYDASGEVQAAGNVKGCIDCHSKMKENDYIFTEIFIE